jgi:hypothetical protein
LFVYEYSRECRMIYRGPGYFSVVWFGSSPFSPLHLQASASCFSFSVFLGVAGLAYLLFGVQDTRILYTSTFLVLYILPPPHTHHHPLVTHSYIVIILITLCDDWYLRGPTSSLMDTRGYIHSSAYSDFVLESHCFFCFITSDWFSYSQEFLCFSSSDWRIPKQLTCSD